MQSIALCSPTALDEALIMHDSVSKLKNDCCHMSKKSETYGYK